MTTYTCGKCGKDTAFMVQVMNFGERTKRVMVCFNEECRARGIQKSEDGWLGDEAEAKALGGTVDTPVRNKSG